MPVKGAVRVVKPLKQFVQGLLVVKRQDNGKPEGRITPMASQPGASGSGEGPMALELLPPGRLGIGRARKKEGRHKNRPLRAKKSFFKGTAFHRVAML